MHTYIHFVIYEVQKHLVTHVSMLYCIKISNIHCRAATRPSYTQTNKYCRFNGCGQNKTALRQTIGWTNLIPLYLCIHHLKWHTVTAFVSVPRHIIIYMYSVYSINGLWVYLIYRLGNLAFCQKQRMHGLYSSNACMEL